MAKNNGILKSKSNRMSKSERYKWKPSKCIVENLMHMYRYKRIYHVGGGLSISLGGLYVGALLDQEAETVQLVVSGRVVRCQVAIVVCQCDVTVSLY